MFGIIHEIFQGGLKDFPTHHTTQQLLVARE